MSYHSTVYTNKEMRALLGDKIDRFVLASIKGRPAKTKHKIVFNGSAVTIFGGDFIAKGYII